MRYKIPSFSWTEMNKPNNTTSALGKDTNKLLKARNPAYMPTTKE